jgi:uncharacterized membrane protein (UPF0127 family)
VVTGLVACGDDRGDDDHDAGDRAVTTDAQLEVPDDLDAAMPTGPVGDAQLLELSGGAPAAGGAALAEPPGPAERDLLAGFGEVAIAITAPDGTVTGWCVLVAATHDQRARGLMEVTDLGGYAGMVFVYAADSEGGFYMRNTPTPLSIGWFDADGALVSASDMEPCPDIDGCPTYHPEGPYRFALEVPQGDLEQLGATEGSRLALGGSCAAG